MKDLNNGENSPCSWIERITVVKMQYSQIDLQLQNNLFQKFKTNFYVEVGMLLLKFIQKWETQNSQKNTKMNKAGAHTLSDFKNLSMAQ